MGRAPYRKRTGFRGAPKSESGERMMRSAWVARPTAPEREARLAVELAADPGPPLRKLAPTDK
jgi:hypothetical protein